MLGVELLRAPAGDRVRCGHDVTDAERHQAGIAQNVLHAVFSENAVTQLRDDNVGAPAPLLREPVEETTRDRHRHPGVGAGRAGVVERERGDRARIEHGEGIAHEGNAGELAGAHPEPRARQPAHQLGGGDGLPGVHAGSRDEYHGHGAFQRLRRRNRAVHDRRGPADPVAQLGKGQHRPQHLGLKRRADVGVGRGAAPEHPAQVEDVDHVAHGNFARDVAGVAPQRAPGAEGTRQDVTGPEGDHPPPEILDGVVGGFVLQNPDGEDVALARNDLLAHDHVEREPRVPGGRSDPVESDASCADHGYGR